MRVFIRFTVRGAQHEMSFEGTVKAALAEVYQKYPSAIITYLDTYYEANHGWNKQVNGENKCV